MKRINQILMMAVAILCVAFISPEAKTINVVIDAGHGGKDWGATHENLTEKEIVASITEKIRLLNTRENVKIHFTRTADEMVELGNRAKFINEIKPDLVLSLHVNQNPSNLESGMEIFVAREHENRAKSMEYATLLSEKLTRNHNAKIRKIADAPFFILKKSNAPALTVELGFISNKADREMLTDEASQEALAKTLLEFISELK